MTNSNNPNQYKDQIKPARASQEISTRCQRNWPRPAHGSSDPLTYQHPYPSMCEFARMLALRYDTVRTRHCYYRAMRLVHQHFRIDPASLTETQIRDYFLFVKTKKHWKPKTIRQSAASCRLFYCDMLAHKDWKVFSQIRTKDHDVLPEVLSRSQIISLLRAIRLRRYRVPIKLIYCAGLRLSECLAVTVHDLSNGKLRIRAGKRHKDRIVPLGSEMLEDLRRYWSFHRHPLLLFPNAGRGSNNPREVARRMHSAKGPMPVSSLQRLIIVARNQLNIPAASIHTLRHSTATHLIEAGVSVPAVKALLGHKNVETTMVYVHLTSLSEQRIVESIEELTKGLPR